jgi:hypothetical protein
MIPGKSFLPEEDDFGSYDGMIAFKVHFAWKLRYTGK